MNLKLKLKTNFDQLEKASIAFIFFTLLISLFVGEGALSTVVFGLSIFGLVVLWGIYLLTADRDFLRWPLAFIIFSIVYLLAQNLNLEASNPLWLFAGLSFFVFGILLIINSLKDTVANKNFELLTFLMGFFIAIRPLIYLLHGKELEQLKSILGFASAFVIATVIYNDNLWERNSFNSKNLIKIIFILILSQIFSQSLKNISF